MSNKETPIHNIPFELPKNIKMERKEFQKLLFLSNVLDQGWTIKKRNDTYIQVIIVSVTSRWQPLPKHCSIR